MSFPVLFVCICVLNYCHRVAVVLLLDGEDFLAREEDVFVPVLGMPLKDMLCSRLSDLLQSGSKEVSLQLPVGSHV